MNNFRTIDRQTGFLLPPSVDEWLPEKHLARFVVEVIDGMDLRAMSGSYRGSGSASYHPRMLLGILVYGYSTGIFSSRDSFRSSREGPSRRSPPPQTAPDASPVATRLPTEAEEIRSGGQSCGNYSSGRRSLQWRIIAPILSQTIPIPLSPTGC